MFWFVIISAGLLLLDVLTKKWAVFQLYTPIKVLPFLAFEYVENRGAAFGLLAGAGVVLSLVGLAVCIYIFYFMLRERSQSRLQYAGLTFLFAGAFGNLLNRLMLGYVIDFIRLPNWPNFNLADIYINIGVILLVIYVWRKESLERNQKSN